MSFKMKFILGGAAALLIGPAALQAHDDSMQRLARSTTVQFTDLNLEQPGDVAALYQRIKTATAKVCASRAFTGINYTLPEYQSCVGETLQKAVANIDRAPLTAFYKQQLKQSGSITLAAQ